MPFNVPVNQIRQWRYCPRIVYYMELTSYKVVRPAWVRQGAEFHAAEEQLWRRRNLSRFNLASGKRHHNLPLASDKLSMHGIADLAIETDQHVYAAEFKLSATSKKQGDILQLTAYAMLLEEHFGKPSPVGFLLGRGKILHSIDICAQKRREVALAVRDIGQMLAKGLKPHSNAAVAQCCNCEYLNHCNDRL